MSRIDHANVRQSRSPGARRVGRLPPMKTSEAGRESCAWRRFAPLALAAAALVLFFALRLDRYVSLERLIDSRSMLLGAIAGHRVAAAAAFAGVYAGLVAISAPGATVMTVAAGALFGVWLGVLCSAVGATAGACGLFLAARSALGAGLAARAGPRLLRLQDKFQHHAVGYLLFLRLSPFFPFWFVNLAAALAGVRFTTFLWTTALGVLPAAFVFAATGASLDGLAAAAIARREACLTAGHSPCPLDLPLSAVVTPQIFILLICLSLVALAPIAAKRLWADRKREAAH